MSLREWREVEQGELARLVGVTPQAWSAWELGARPKSDKLAQIAEALGTTVGWLVAGEGNPPATAQSVKAPPVKLTPILTGKDKKRKLS